LSCVVVVVVVAVVVLLGGSLEELSLEKEHAEIVDGACSSPAPSRIILDRLVFSLFRRFSSFLFIIIVMNTSQRIYVCMYVCCCCKRVITAIELWRGGWLTYGIGWKFWISIETVTQLFRD
jgi:hypothetical protein